METVTPPNLYQAAPYLVIHLPLCLVAFTTSLLSLFNTDMLKIPSRHYFRVYNSNYSLIRVLTILQTGENNEIISSSVDTNNED